MKVLLVSDQKKIAESFSALEKSPEFPVETVSPAQYRQRLKNGEPREPLLVYLDLHQKSKAEGEKEIKFLLKQPQVLLGIIDPKNLADDPAVLFHAGLADYLGKKQLQEGITPKRLRGILEYKSHPGSGQDKDAGKTKKKASPPAAKKKKEFSGEIIPGGKWGEVKSGTEYVFYFLFAELDLSSEWKKKAGQEHLKQVKEIFHNYIAQTMEPYNGRIWMWNEFGGLVLFPYTKAHPSSVLCAARLMANLPIASCEDFPFKVQISCRLAIHLGETQYKDRGKTGTIVSDSVNSAFHLGQRYAKPGNLYLSSEVYEKTHPALQGLFVADGLFENRQIYRLRKFKGAS